MNQRCRLRRWVLGCLLPAAGVLNPAWGISDGNVASTIDPNVVAIDEQAYLGSTLDRHFRLRDADGRIFDLSRYRGKPLILLFSYYTCDGLCGTINRHLQGLIDRIKGHVPGKDFNVLTVSFDRHDNPSSIRAFMRRNRLQDKPGWTLAILDNPDDILKLTGSVGVRFFWSYRDKVFLHPNAFIFVSPRGRVVRYLYGTLVSPRDVELALIDANWEKVAESGKLIDILAGACFSYNFKEGRYTINYPLLIGGGSLFGGIALVVLSFLWARKKTFGRKVDA